MNKKIVKFDCIKIKNFCLSKITLRDKKGRQRVE